MESGTEIFAELAVMYAKETVCDKAEAQQAAPANETNVKQAYYQNSYWI